MLILQTIPAAGLFLAVPVQDGKPSNNIEFVFENEEDQSKFIHLHARDPEEAARWYWQKEQEQYNAELYAHMEAQDNGY